MGAIAISLPADGCQVPDKDNAQEPCRHYTTEQMLREEGTRVQLRRIPHSFKIALAGALLVVPCFWESRIQAGDLASHAYNAWLASRISEGLLPGLWIVRQWNNVLFDLTLEFLSSHLGTGAAQRIAVAGAVLIFASGGIRYMSRGRKENPWFVLPCAAIFAYGFIFHLGFFNFYISMGLCLWYLGIFLSTGWRRRLLAAPLLPLAWIAHPLPVVWAAGLAVYAGIAEHLSVRRRNWLMGAGILVIVATHFVLSYNYESFWSTEQLQFVTGANQSLLFDVKYVAPFTLLLSIWILLLRRFLKARTWRNLYSDISVQLWLLTAAAVVSTPSAVTFPQFALPFSFITTRLSMAAGILLCGVLSQVPLGKIEKLALLATAIIFFAFLYHDTRKFNRVEEQVDAAVEALPVGSRVIAMLLPTYTHGNALLHVIDRACIGHCFSYANYEPSSRQFRIRAAEGNRFVLSDYNDVADVESGEYHVQARDLPLFFVYSCGPAHDHICTRQLHEGDDIGVVSRGP
jgi:hypothetical protein